MNQLLQNQSNIPNPLPVAKIVNCPGKRIQDYVFVKELGKGAYGQVFSARNVNTNELVAVKCVPRVRLSEHNGIVGELLNSEVQVLQQINNEHVVRLITYLESANQCYIIMEFCNSGDFEQLWKSRQKKISEDEAIDYMKQVLAGMQALHEKKVLHRDLKLANILIHNSVLKIADLGFCKQLSDQNQTERLSLGSLGNMAPEVVEQKPYGMAADMFSIGSMFYQLIFGQFPFTNIDAKAFLNDIRNNPPNFRKNNIIISPQLEELLAKMLKMNPYERLKWNELYQHPLMQQKNMKLAPLSINALQAGQLDTQKMKQFYDNEQNQKQEDQIQDHKDYLSKLNISQHQQNLQIVSQRVIEEDIQSPNLQSEKIRQLEAQAEEQIRKEKQIQEYLEKYMRLRDPMVYLQRTLNEIQVCIPQQESAFLCLMLSKKLQELGQNLSNKLLKEANIFNTDLIKEIYRHPYFEKFRYQILDDVLYYQDVTKIMYTDVRNNLNSVGKYIQQTWITELQQSEASDSFIPVFKETLVDFIFKLGDKRDKEKDQKLQEQYLEIQIFLLYCLQFEKLNYLLPPNTNINNEFEELPKSPVQIKLDKFNQLIQIAIY